MVWWEKTETPDVLCTVTVGDGKILSEVKPDKGLTWSRALVGITVTWVGMQHHVAGEGKPSAPRLEAQESRCGWKRGQPGICLCLAMLPKPLWKAGRETGRKALGTEPI